MAPLLDSLAKLCSILALLWVIFLTLRRNHSKNLVVDQRDQGMASACSHLGSLMPQGCNASRLPRPSFLSIFQDAWGDLLGLPNPVKRLACTDGGRRFLRLAIALKETDSPRRSARVLESLLAKVALNTLYVPTFVYLQPIIEDVRMRWPDAGFTTEVDRTLQLLGRLPAFDAGAYTFEETSYPDEATLQRLVEITMLDHDGNSTAAVEFNALPWTTAFLQWFIGNDPAMGYVQQPISKHGSIDKVTIASPGYDFKIEFSRVWEPR